MYGLTLVTPPAEEPVSLDRAKLHLRVDHDVDDELIASLIAAARGMSETHCRRAWVEQTLRMTLADWPRDASGMIPLPVEPVLSVESVKYYATSGTLTTLTPVTGYQTWLDHSPPLIAAAPQVCWPQVEIGRLGAVQVEFTAGYGTADDVPEMAKAAILLCVGYWYENRGDGADPTGMVNGMPLTLGVPQGAKRLLDSLRTGAY